MEKDKLLHFIACETIALVATILFLILGCGDYSFPIAFVVALGAGIGKEAYDKKKTGLFDHMDIVFDFIGAFVAMILAYFIHIA